MHINRGISVGGSVWRIWAVLQAVNVLAITEEQVLKAPIAPAVPRIATSVTSAIAAFIMVGITKGMSMNETSSTPRDWLEAELEDTLDELYENEFSEPMLTEEIRKIYKDKQPDMLDRRVYYRNLLRLQMELIKLQHWVEATGAKILIICEGRDSAGKGGVIKRIAQRLNPRVARVVALPKPSEREQTQWYFQRYVPHLPAGGEIVLFDRSWYNRALIEPTMGYCTERQYRYFMKKVIDWEHELIANGMMLIKFYLSVDSETQLFRFKERVLHPLKYWKYTKNDERARIKWRIFSKFKKHSF